MHSSIHWRLLFINPDISKTVHAVVVVASFSEEVLCVLYMCDITTKALSSGGSGRIFIQ